MKIVEILKDAAILLGLTQDVAAFDSITEDNEQVVLAENPNVLSLFNLSKLSIRELCTNYLPVSQSEKITTSDKEYAVSNLTNFIRVQNAFKNEEMVKFKMINRNLIFEEDGEYEVVYLTYPNILSVFDEIDFLDHLSPDVVILGVCSYYSLAHGMFEDFEKMHDKYIQRAESLKELKIFSLPSRRWE